MIVIYSLWLDNRYCEVEASYTVIRPVSREEPADIEIEPIRFYVDGDEHSLEDERVSRIMNEGVRT